MFIKGKAVVKYPSLSIVNPEEKGDNGIFQIHYSTTVYYSGVCL